MSDLTVSMIQTPLVWEDIPANLALFEEKIKPLKKGQVVVLPEMFNTGFSMNAKKLAEEMDGPTISWMKAIAREKKIILTGSLIIKDHGRYYNRLIWALPDGKIAIYDKRHRFSYVGEDRHFSAGTDRVIAQVNGWKVGLFICYDLRFPVWLRQIKEAEGRYDLMIVIANWPASRITAWDTLLRARAIENQCFVAGLNRTGKDGNDIIYNGHSGFYDPLGERLQLSEEKESIVQQVLQKDRLKAVRQKFPFLEDADEFRFKK